MYVLMYECMYVYTGYSSEIEIADEKIVFDILIINLVFFKEAQVSLFILLCYIEDACTVFN